MIDRRRILTLAGATGALTIAMPFIRPSTVAFVLPGTIMAVVPEGAPPLRHALTLMTNSSVPLILPSFNALNTTASVISLLMLAGGLRSSARC
mgnify:CR=1 FL=1